MIAFLNGITAEISETSAVIDVGGVGYEVFISPATAARMPGPGEPVKFHTYMAVREDDCSLYGFLTRDELSIFKLLISVSGIGPKGAQAILSTLSPDDLRFAILAGDAKAIAKAPGVGKKTAERMVLELHDKVGAGAEAAGEPIAAGSGLTGASAGTAMQEEAIEALVQLGYGASDAMRAVRKAAGQLSAEEQTSESLLKAALKELFV